MAMTVTIPRSLGRRQLFVLAYVTEKYDEQTAKPDGHYWHGFDPTVVARTVVVGAAMKEWGKEMEENHYGGPFGGNYGPNYTTNVPPEEDAGTGRALRTLTERGLLERIDGETRKRFGRPREKMCYKYRGYRPTDRGREVAEEILRRVEDGRYALDFDGVPFAAE